MTAYLSRASSVMPMAAIPISKFQYEPLAHAVGAIRLLRVHPNLSEEGLIQVHLWHATIHSTYECLSYVWGTKECQHTILLNGKSVRVRKNLYAFLEIARTQYADRNLWIDALCINQESLLEKNHQVAQMGIIYTKATQVLAWLGHSPEIERAFRFCVELHARGLKMDIGAGGGLELFHSRNQQSDWQLHRDWLAVSNCSYWQRAWITQEILLSGTFRMLINDFAIEPKSVSEIYKYRSKDEPQVFSTYMRELCGESLIYERSLIFLFHELPKRKCENPRDRIYSLYSVASDAAALSIRYEAPICTVLTELLYHLKKSLCPCLWIYLVDALECWRESALSDSHVVLSMKPVGTEYFMAADLGMQECCSFCQHPVNVSGQSMDCEFFCLAETCRRVLGLHFYLLRHKSNDKYEYKIRREHDLSDLNVAGVYIEDLSVGLFSKDIDWTTDLNNIPDEPSTRPTLHIKLTAWVFTEMLMGFMTSETDTTILSLCWSALEGRASIVFSE